MVYAQARSGAAAASTSNPPTMDALPLNITLTETGAFENS